MLREESMRRGMFATIYVLASVMMVHSASPHIPICQDLEKMEFGVDDLNIITGKAILLVFDHLSRYYEPQIKKSEEKYIHLIKVHREHQQAEHPKLNPHHVQPALDEKSIADEFKAISEKFNVYIDEIQIDEESIDERIHHNMLLLASGSESKDERTAYAELQQSVKNTIETELCSPVAVVLWSYVADADHQMKVIAHAHGVPFERMFKPTFTVNAPTFEQDFRAEFKFDHPSAEHEVTRAEHHFFFKHTSQYIKSVLKQIVRQEWIIQQHLDAAALKKTGQIEESPDLQAALTMMRDLIEKLNEEVVNPLIINRDHGYLNQRHEKDKTSKTQLDMFLFNVKERIEKLSITLQGEVVRLTEYMEIVEYEIERMNVGTGDLTAVSHLSSSSEVVHKVDEQKFEESHRIQR